MKKLTEGLAELFLMIGAAITVLVFLPGIIVGVGGHDAGLLISLLLLFAVDPAFFAFLGMYAGKQGFNTAVKGIVLAGGAFAFGAALVLKMSGDFVMKYMAVYLAIGFAAMGLTAWSGRKNAKK